MRPNSAVAVAGAGTFGGRPEAATGAGTVFIAGGVGDGMTLAFDPAEIDAADIGERQATLEMDHEAAVEHVRETAEATGFGVPVEFSPAELLNEKLDREADEADRDPYYVLGACNPRMADRALDETLKQGALFPCNFVVWEAEPGVQRVYHVSIMKIARLVGIAPDNDAWDGIVEDTGALVEAFFEEL